VPSMRLPPVKSQVFTLVASAASRKNTRKTVEGVAGLGDTGARLVGPVATFHSMTPECLATMVHSARDDYASAETIENSVVSSHQPRNSAVTSTEQKVRSRDTVPSDGADREAPSLLSAAGGIAAKSTSRSRTRPAAFDGCCAHCCSHACKAVEGLCAQRARSDVEFGVAYNHETPQLSSIAGALGVWARTK
jgi:hypothetical protein